MGLSRSCQNCIRVKRRCSLHATCNRCRERGESCVYINPPAAAQSGTSTYTLSSPVFNVPLLRRPSGCGVYLTFDNDSVRYITRKLRTCPLHRRRLYMHRAVFNALQHPVPATTLFYLFNRASRDLLIQERESVTQMLEQSVKHLIIYTERTRPEAADLLVCIQALLKALVTLTVGNSAGDISDAGTRLERAQQVKALSRWCSRLLAFAPWELPRRVSSELALMFAESVRRTLLVAHIFCDVLSTILYGSFEFSGFILTLPYDAANTSGWKKGASVMSRTAGAGLRSLRELAIESNGVDSSSDDVDEFERILLVACGSYRRAANM